MASHGSCHRRRRVLAMTTSRVLESSDIEPSVECDRVGFMAFPLHSPKSSRRRWFCALGLSASYSVLYLFAALCLATGVFHPEVRDHHAHPHHDHAAHEHGASESHPRPALPDICDLTLQALMTVMWQGPYTPHFALLQTQPQWDAIPAAPVTPLLAAFRSRAPPELHFMWVIPKRLSVWMSILRPL
jgi:hypothetical protein